MQVPIASKLSVGDILAGMNGELSDVWGDAQMPEVCEYLFGNNHCEIPADIKAHMPKWL